MKVAAPQPAYDAINEPLTRARELLKGVLCGTAEGNTIRRREWTGKASNE
jgi:hypothetical protein